MSFPTSPSDKDVYGNHRWDASIGAWIKFPVADQTEAEAGTDGSVQMTPERATQTVGEHAEVNSNSTHRGSDGSDHSKVGANETAIALNTTHRGSSGSGDHSDIGANTTHRTGNGSDHTNVALNDTHRGSNGSDHSKVGANETAIGLNTTHRGSSGTDHSNVGLNNSHRTNNNQAHTDYLKNNAVDVGVGLTLTGDNNSGDTAYVPMVLYGTDATPPSASGFPRGTIYIQYTP